MSAFQGEPPSLDEQARFEIIMKHGHQDLVQAVAFNAYGDRCATGSVDGKIRVFNRHAGGVWRLCDSWLAHGGEILELQWLPPTIYPNLLASLGVEGRFKLWTEDPAAAPGRRFSQRAKGSNAKAAYETRSPRSVYRSFSMKHNDETRHTNLALLAADGTLTVLENEQPENLADYASVDELRVCPRPPRGEEASFRVRFDPNPDPCYTALRAGVRADALSLVIAAMDSVKIYRTRPITTSTYGLQGTGRAFYLAAEIRGHRGLVRDVAWAPGNFRGYDIIATACQDGYVRVVRLDTPFSAADDGKSWAVGDVVKTGTGADNRKKRNAKPASALSAAAAAAAAAAATVASSPADAGSGAAGVDGEGGAGTAGGAGAGAGAGVSNVGATSALSAAVAAAAGNGSSNGSLSLLGAESGAANAGGAGAGADAGAGAGGAGIGGAGAGNEDAVGGLVGTNTHPNSSAVSSADPSFSGMSAPETERNGLGNAPPPSHAPNSDRRWTGEPGQVRHTVRELSKLENRRTPVWRVAFDDDGHILGTVGDDGKLLCYRQTPDGAWARSSELTVMKMRMTAP